MAEKKEAAAGSIWHELFQFGVYKRSQGRFARQATFFAMVAIVAVGCWRLSTLITERSVALSVAGGLLALGVWLSYRLVNMPRFADFLIAVEAEMNKVSWPSKDELIRSSIVVIVTMVVMVVALYAFDTLWAILFRVIGVR